MIMVTDTQFGHIKSLTEACLDLTGECPLKYLNYRPDERGDGLECDVHFTDGHVAHGEAEGVAYLAALVTAAATGQREVPDGQ
jgi:hypothetical protein